MSSCKTCKELQCNCKKRPLGTTLDVLPITPSCDTPTYCNTECDESIAAKCVTVLQKTYCFLKDKNGNPIKNSTSVQNVLEGLDILMCELKNSLDNCCGTLQTFSVACLPTDTFTLLQLKRNSVTISTNLKFNTLLDLLNYLTQYDDFYLDMSSIKVKSVFNCTVDVICTSTNCPLQISIIPYNDPEEIC